MCPTSCQQMCARHGHRTDLLSRCGGVLPCPCRVVRSAACTGGAMRNQLGKLNFRHIRMSAPRQPLPSCGRHQRIRSGCHDYSTGGCESPGVAGATGGRPLPTVFPYTVPLARYAALRRPSTAERHQFHNRIRQHVSRRRHAAARRACNTRLLPTFARAAPKTAPSRAPTAAAAARRRAYWAQTPPTILANTATGSKACSANARRRRGTLL